MSFLVTQGYNSTSFILQGLTATEDSASELTYDGLIQLMKSKFGPYYISQPVPDLLLAIWTLRETYSLINPSGKWADYNIDKRKYDYLRSSPKSVKWMLPASPPDPRDYLPSQGGNSGGNNGLPQQPAIQTVGPTINARTYAALDGTTDDTAAIQSALDALPATGGTLIIDGVAAINSSGLLLRGKDHITIMGTATGAGFKPLAVSRLNFGGFTNAMLLLQYNTNVAITGITIQGNAQAVIGIGIDHSSNTIIMGNEISNVAGSAAVASIGGRNNQYWNNNVHDTPAGTRGLWIGNSNDGELEYSPIICGNTITNTGATAIATLSHDAYILNNTGLFTAGAGIALAGVTAFTTQNAYVANNVMNYNGYQGIQADCWSDTVPIGPCTIENNTCNNNDHSGIYVVKATGWIVRNNTTNDNINPGSAGILVEAASNIIVENNTGKDTRTTGKTQPAGVKVLAESPNSILNVTVRNNTADGNAYAGIIVVNSGSGTMDGVTIANNDCTNNTVYGLFIVESSPNTILDVIVSNNTFSGNGQDTRINLATPPS